MVHIGVNLKSTVRRRILEVRIGLENIDVSCEYVVIRIAPFNENVPEGLV